MNWEVIQGDCLQVMRGIPSASVDACITDPPYGTTACSWDSVIPFAPMWAELKRIVKPKGAIVLFGSQPFTSALVMSNPGMFKYELIWEKEQGTYQFAANIHPLSSHENVVVFCASGTIYNPQMEQGAPYFADRKAFTEAYTMKDRRYVTDNGGERFPKSIIRVGREMRERYHTNQKPVDLLRYLVRTYTNAGDAVLDFTCGSGTAGVACAIEGRDFIGIEQDAGYCEISRARIKRAQGIACDIPRPTRPERPMPLFESVA